MTEREQIETLLESACTAVQAAEAELCIAEADLRYAVGAQCRGNAAGTGSNLVAARSLCRRARATLRELEGRRDQLLAQRDLIASRTGVRPHSPYKPLRNRSRLTRQSRRNLRRKLRRSISRVMPRANQEVARNLGRQSVALFSIVFSYLFYYFADVQLQIASLPPSVSVFSVVS